MSLRIICFAALAILWYCAHADTQPFVAPNAPKDVPVTACGAGAWAALEERMKPYIETARASYPAAKQRYLKGLPPHHSFGVTVELRDEWGVERVFLLVEKIKNHKISGRIWSELNKVRSWKQGDDYSVSEGSIFDWIITNPDGSEDGNFVGKFLDGLDRKCSGT